MTPAFALAESKLRRPAGRGSSPGPDWSIG
jgi:hypothetical protein